jgi:hypothetical protein
MGGKKNKNIRKHKRTPICSRSSVADKLARFFHDNSSDLNYDNEFLNKEKTMKSRVFDISQQY